MAYDKNDYDADEVDIYRYNETTAQWEKQQGTVDEEAGIISLTIPHFSTYAVFADVPEDDSDDQDGDDGDRDDDGDGAGDDGDRDDDGDDTGDDGTPGGKDDQNGARNGDGGHGSGKGGNGQKLPQTATNFYNWLVAGVVLMLIGTGLLLYLRRRKN